MDDAKRWVRVILVPRKSTDKTKPIEVVVDHLKNIGTSVKVRGDVDAMEVECQIDDRLTNKVRAHTGKELNTVNARIDKSGEVPTAAQEVKNAKGVLKRLGTKVLRVAWRVAEWAATVTGAQ